MRGADSTFIETRETIPSSSGCLVLRDLDPATTEDTVRQVMGVFGALKEVRLVRDKVSYVSRGFAFVDYISPGDASQALHQIGVDGGLKVDGKTANISFASDTKAMAPSQSSSKGMSSVAAQALAAASWGMGMSTAVPAPTPSASTAKEAQPGGQTGTEGAKFTFDQSSGLYYDSTSGFYYDPTNQVYLYYSAEQKTYMYWDAQAKGYVRYDPKTYSGAKGVVDPTAAMKSNNAKSKGKMVEKDMNKWFQRNRERAATESLTMGMQDNTVASETMPLQTVTDEASIALANAAANLAERTAAGGTEPSQTANEAGETEDGGWTTKVDASSAVQKLALERAKAREAAQARPTATDPASSAFATPDLVALGTNYDTCRQLTIDGKPFVVSQNGKWACLVSRRQFKTEEQIREHIQLSSLYRDCLVKAVADGKVLL